MALKTKLKQELSAVLNIVDDDQFDAVCEAIAKAIVDELTENGVVSVSSGSSAGSYSISGVTVG